MNNNLKLNLKKYPDPLLRKKSETIKEISPEIQNLAKEMSLIMEKEAGIGLAAPQAGVLKRIITVRTETGPEAFVNPEIIKTSKETEIMEEGCLSFPGLFLKIKRAKTIELEALNLKGKKLFLRTEGLLARVFQHEIDHLNGILFIDRIGFWQRLKVKIRIK